MDITGIVLILILLVPTVIGIIKDELVWDGSQFTLKEKDQEPETPDLQKINDSYIISKKVKI